jgi:hypothetical protein
MQNMIQNTESGAFSGPTQKGSGDFGGPKRTVDVEGPLVVMNQRIVGCCETICQQQNALRGVTNRLFGTLSLNPSTAQKEEPEPEGQYGEMERSIGNLEALCSCLREEVLRLQESA